MCLLKAVLPEILNSRYEHADVVVAGDVFVEPRACSFGVAHLAEHAAVGGGYALYGAFRAVGVIEYVLCRPAGHIDILRGNLTVRCKLLYELAVRDKSAFAVRYRNVINIANIRIF